ncbi:hypothetical protein EJ05DRAFT_72003 [Pseudovirgaria hyperparasitica]|uniref:DUF7896 domain-containing protein n=1 Tax=Pseudovirgaria hyperparasitica TaxID=470096 RepID=A0A6A6W273_9PEZI|nr:uncharacterized protein EJ05DRAFT_72003 [Pseudovirgaria hyperparasitica]KAF2756663.1 hypothetical protein EJ05DRAFT_72003 [Pseudovirgaria hyperparasitica]
MNASSQSAPAESFCGDIYTNFADASASTFGQNAPKTDLSFGQPDFHYGGTSPTESASSIDTPTSSAMESQLSCENSSAGTSYNSTPFEMLRVDSNVSACSNVCTRESSLFPESHHVKFESSNSNFITSPVFVSAVDQPQSLLSSYGVQEAPYSQSVTQSDLVEEMQRSTSYQSAVSTQSRCSQRKQEVLASAARPIAPKSATETAASRASCQTKMVRIKSQDGSSKDVAQITKAPYIRPQHPKTLCPHCNEYPDGFRGEHELRRHVDRKHATVKKVWVTVDASEGKRFLANCKQCRNRKQYGAYYNAAAHLRRAHFHPRKRGRKGKHDSEKRGGKGGGDDPPMDYLKQHWMKEIEVHVSNDALFSNSDGDVVDTQEAQSPCDVPYNFTHSHIVDEHGVPQYATAQLPSSASVPTTSIQASTALVTPELYQPQFDPSSSLMGDYSAYDYTTAYQTLDYSSAFDFGNAHYNPTLFANNPQ